MVNGKVINRLPGLTVCELSGTPYEIGLTHGRLFGPEIALMRARLVRYLGDMTLGLGGRALLWYLGRVARRMERYVPYSLIAEMKGIADGAGAGYGVIFLINALDDILVNFSCSSIAVSPERSGTGKLIVGRNLDYPLFYDLLPRLTTVFKVRPETGHPFVSVGWPGFSALTSGMNDAGLVLADLTSLSTDRSLKGTPALLMNRIALQNSGNLDELVDTIRKGRRTVGKNLMAASPEKALVLEISARNFNVREASGGYLTCTNHFEDPVMAKLQGSLKKPPPKSDFPEHYYSYAFSKERLDRLGSMAGEGRPGLEEIKRALATEPVANPSTVQSMIFVPGERRLYVARSEHTPVSQGEFEDIQGPGLPNQEFLSYLHSWNSHTSKDA